MSTAIEHTYRVVVTREGAAWLAEVGELEGAHTHARTLRALDKAVREVIVLAADLPDEAMGGLVLDYDYRTGDPEIDAAAAEVRARRAEVERARVDVAERTTAAAGLLLSRGLHVRDAAALLAVSPQRISQVTSKAS